MTILYFNVDDENENENNFQFSLFLNLDWLDEYAEKNGWGDIGKFLKEYNSEDVNEVIIALDEDGEQYSIQEEHQFSGFAD